MKRSMGSVDKKKYIECEALKRDLIDNRNFYPAIVKRAIEKAPAADVVEVKHGFWRTTDAYPHWLCCSECNVKFLPNIEWIGRYDIPTKYCPNCGACMDGEEPT